MPGNGIGIMGWRHRHGCLALAVAYMLGVCGGGEGTDGATHLRHGFGGSNAHCNRADVSAVVVFVAVEGAALLHVIQRSSVFLLLFSIIHQLELLVGKKGLTSNL